ncbi:Piwi domain-containing protein [Halosimplex aquaticum]
MVAVSSLSEDDYLGNIAAGLVAKCGGIPWRVHDVPGDTDVFIGLDVTYDTETEQHVGASANVVLGDGSILASQSTSLQSGETFQIDDIVDVIKNLLNIYLEEEDGTPNHVVIHRDGQFYLDLEALVERLEKAVTSSQSSISSRSERVGTRVSLPTRATDSKVHGKGLHLSQKTPITPICDDRQTGAASWNPTTDPRRKATRVDRPLHAGQAGLLAVGSPRCVDQSIDPPADHYILCGPVCRTCEERVSPERRTSQRSPICVE